MEKVYKSMIYVAMKTYAAIMYESPTDKGKLDVKGLAAVKSDTSPLTRKLQTDVINAITSEPNKAWPVVKHIVQTAITTIKAVGEDQLVKRVKLGSGYKNPDRMVQVHVVAKMKSRGQQEPRQGERVSFIVTKGDITSKRICDRADHPDHVLAENIDYDYYIERQIIRPVQRILDIIHSTWRRKIIY
jgi:DNA polymerase elongation subunit (family B)